MASKVWPLLFSQAASAWTASVMVGSVWGAQAQKASKNSAKQIKKRFIASSFKTRQIYAGNNQKGLELFFLKKSYIDAWIKKNLPYLCGPFGGMGEWLKPPVC
jgi:hypothetical protein